MQPYLVLIFNAMKKILPLKSVLGYALIFIMIGTSLMLNNKEIILPEMAALAMGCLVYEHPAWLAKPFHIFLLPSITAIGGFLINQTALPLPAKLILAIAFVLLTLLTFKSSLAPALATGLLPVITNVTSVYFIYAILALTLLLVAFMYIEHKVPQMPASIKRKPKDSILYLSFISVWILLCAQNKWMYIAAIPPVLVVGFESIHIPEYPFTMFYKQVITLFLAATIGITGLYFFGNLLLAALFDIIAVTLMLRMVKFKLVPAYAMSLLPMVLHNPSYRYFYWQVLVMAIVVLGTIYGYKNLRFKNSLSLGLTKEKQ